MKSILIKLCLQIYTIAYKNVDDILENDECISLIVK